MTEDTDAEDTDAEDTDAEDTDAEDTDAEDTDAEDTDAEEARVYAVRLSQQADRDLTEAMLYLDRMTGDETLVKQWLAALYLEIGRLATIPHRYSIIERETRLFGRETRQMVYRRTVSSVAYLVLFSVTEDGEEGPTVIILHIRHGSRKPLTRAEAKKILDSQ